MFALDGYRALRAGAAVVRRADRGLLVVSGSDRAQWLQGLVTNDVAAMPPGSALDAACLTPQGRMISDLRVMALDDRMLLDVPASLAAALAARFDALIFSEDTQLEDASQRLTMVDVHGPEAPTVGAKVRERFNDGVEAIVADSPFGVPGVTFVCAVGEAERLVTHLIEAGALETNLATLDVVRVEAGRPAFLVDMNEQTIPLEAGLEDRAISFTKGCYVGQEVIVRVLHRGGGRVARKLVGLTLGSGDVPDPGAAIVAGEREIGRITSAVWSPSLDAGIGLGYVMREFIEPGTSLKVRTPHGEVDATVSSVPFVGA
ncbi:MAG: CAF17-like 4Fe-4S cluster assembly/insertion protein YgfZ [Acidobacteriota bacterium]